MMTLARIAASTTQGRAKNVGVVALWIVGLVASAVAFIIVLWGLGRIGKWFEESLSGLWVGGGGIVVVIVGYIAGSWIIAGIGLGLVGLVFFTMLLWNL